MVDLKGTKTVPDCTGVDPANVIGVEMVDLSEKDRNDLELDLQRELEEVMAEKRRQKLGVLPEYEEWCHEEG
jgi:hypothetical protein